MTRETAETTLVDPRYPFPNLSGVPLWMVPNLSEEDHKAVAVLHTRARAAASLAGYAAYAMDLTPATHHRVICSAIDDLLADAYDDLIICSPPGSAKALALDTPIPTPEGWTTMGDLRVGDRVFDEKGLPCNVVWVSPIYRNRPVYAVRTDCGDEIIADRDHEWLVRLCGKPKKALKNVDAWGNPRESSTPSREPAFKIKETHELFRRRAKRPMIARAAALNLPERFLLIDPYVLGVWLGDGTSSAPSVASSISDIGWLRGEMARLGYPTSDRSEPTLFGLLNVRSQFVYYGLINDPFHNTFGRKHIPDDYLRASYSQRLALLQGLIDTDGTVCPKRGNTTFCNTNLELALQVRELVRSLGVKAGWSVGRAMLYGIDHGPVYRVSFYLQNSARMPRKAALTRNQYRTPHTYIDVLPVGTADTVCIEVDSESHLFLCGRSMTPTHNSSYTSHALGAYFMGANPTKNVILATHSADLSERWSRKVRNTLQLPQHAHLFPDSLLSKDSTAVGRWAVVPGGEFLAVGVGTNVLGFRADLAIIDDAVSGFEQAQSETQLLKIHGWFETDLITRLKPGGKIVNICQRLSANDMAGYMIARNAMNPTRRTRVVTLRMEREADDLDDGTHRQPGERLWPQWYTQEMVEDAKRDPYRWQTLYQQRPPSSSGDWVDPSHVIFIDPEQASAARLSNSYAYYLCSDLALSVNKGDYSVHLVVGVDETGTATVVDAWRERCAPERTVERHLDLIAQYRPLESLIDDDNASKVYVQLLASRARERSIPVPWKMMPMRGQDKETRAAALRGMFRSDRIRLVRSPWNEWLVKELLLFPNAIGDGVDDGVDALGLIGRRLAHLARPAGAPLPPPPAKTTQDMCLAELFEHREHSRNRSTQRI